MGEDPYFGYIVFRIYGFFDGGSMDDETQGLTTEEKDAEACAEALESLDRIDVAGVVTFEEDDIAAEDEAQDMSAAGNTPTEGKDDETTEAARDDGAAGADEAAQDDIDPATSDGQDEAPEREDGPEREQGPDTSDDEPVQTQAPSADKTVLIDELPQDESLTRELPGLGSAPAVDETIAIGDIPLPSVPTAQQAEARHRHLSPRRRNLIVAGAVIAALAAGGAGYYAWRGYQTEQAAAEAANAHTMMSVRIGITAAGLDASTGTKIPIQVTGQDADGTAVTETCYVDEKGRGIKLMPGDYTFSVAASPIAADGTVYTVPTKKAEVTVKSEGQDLSGTCAFRLKVPSADTVTDEAIEAAAKYAEDGGCNSAAVAKVLEQAATARRDAAVNAVTARKNQVAREADARHKATNLYQLDIPVEWYGKVATWQNGNTLCIYMAGNTATPLVTLSTVATGQSFTPDDGDTQLGSVDLGNGYTVYASGPVYPYIVPQTINGKTNDPVSKYSMDEAIELVELTTGNRYTYDQIKNDLVDKNGKADAATKLETDYLAQILLPSIKAED